MLTRAQLTDELRANQERRVEILAKAIRLKKGSPSFQKLNEERLALSARADVIIKILETLNE